MNNSMAIRGLSTDFGECRKAIEAGQTVWLLEKNRPHVSRARAVVGGYELIRESGSPIETAHLTDGSTPIPIVQSHMTYQPYPDLHRLMSQIEFEHQGWTSDRTAFKAYSWDVDYEYAWISAGRP